MLWLFPADAIKVLQMWSQHFKRKSIMIKQHIFSYKLFGCAVSLPFPHRVAMPQLQQDPAYPV